MDETNTWMPGSALAPGETNNADLWRIPIGILPDGASDYELYFSEDEIQRASRFHLPEDRDHFIAGRWALRTILSQYFGIGRGDLNFVYGENGKPAIYQTGEAATLNFNLAHSKDLALLGIAFGRRIGVDIEWMRPELNFRQLAHAVFSASELGAFEKLPVAERPAGFYNAWTRKEAYLKAKGDGIAATLQEFSVALIPGEAPRLIEDKEDPGAPEIWNLYDLNVAENYSAAIAIEGEPPIFRFYDF